MESGGVLRWTIVWQLLHSGRVSFTGSTYLHGLHIHRNLLHLRLPDSAFGVPAKTQRGSDSHGERDDRGRPLRHPLCDKILDVRCALGQPL